MKKITSSIVLTLFVTFAFSTNPANKDTSTAAFYTAFDALKNMLEGKDSLNYEKAVFITENAYYNNRYNYTDFKYVIDSHIAIIKTLAESARKEHQQKYKTLKLYQQKMFMLNTANWAIYNYITDTTFIVGNDYIYYNEPYTYSTDDPYGSTNWENTQVIHLLTNDNPNGNCYSLSVLFKIFSDRLQSDARLTVAPHHIYIENRNEKGDFTNVELTTKTFPGDGSIQTLTYTTHELIMKGMSQRMLNDKESIALNLIYLAKGFQHKFNDNTNNFILKCADLAFKSDSLSLNALLLKAEVTENRLFAAMNKNKITTVSQARKNVQTQKLLVSYEKQLSNLYKLGYREIPKDIEHILLSANHGNKDGYITKDKTPNPFASIGQKQRYATLSGGLFDEMHEDVDTIQYFHTSLKTKTKKITEFLPFDTSDNYKVDPVVFAMSVDPLTKKYPYYTPYHFTANSPITIVDDDGRDITFSLSKIQDGTTVLHVTVNAVLLNKSKKFSASGDLEALKGQIESEASKAFSQGFTDVDGAKVIVDFNININVIKDENQIKKNDHVITVVNDVLDNADQSVAGKAQLGGNIINVEAEGGKPTDVAKTVAHELGHNLGLYDEYEYKKKVKLSDKPENLMGTQRGNKLENYQKQTVFHRFKDWAKKDGGETTIRNSTKTNGDSKSENKTFTETNSSTSK